jgi:hypothetical protein
MKTLSLCVWLEKYYREVEEVEEGAIFDVILFNEFNEITETTIANIAVGMENDSGKLEWYTPPACCGSLCFALKPEFVFTLWFVYP